MNLFNKLLLNNTSIHYNIISRINFCCINTRKIIFLIIPVIIIFFIQVHAGEKKPVTITGNNAKTKLVSDEKNGKNYLTEITGSPLIKTDNKELRADRLIIQGNDGEIIEALGNVYMRDKIKNSSISAGKALFYKGKGIIEFYGKPNAIIKREDDNSIVNVRADMMTYNTNDNTAEAKGKVKLINNDLIIQSGKAVFGRESKTAVFSMNPEITRGDDKYTADEILYYTDKKYLILNKNTHVKAYSEEKDNATGKVTRTLVKASGDKIEHFTEGEKLTIITGRAVIEREDSISTGDRFEMKGEKGKEDMTGSNVHINYRKENMEAIGQNFKFYKNEGRSVLWGKSCIITSDAKTGAESSRIYGDYMEHYRDTDELFVAGRVNIIRQDGVIKGDMAKYERKNNLLTVTGNARIEKDNSTSLAQIITIDTKTSDARLQGSISGRKR
jgi:lipopolysaccharide export system protein LptA